MEIDLKSPGMIHAGGCELYLPPLVFDLLAMLAECTGKVVTRAALYYRLWPEDGPNDEQLDAHRRRLVRALKKTLGARADGWVQVVRGQGFRLNLPPEAVCLSRE